MAGDIYIDKSYWSDASGYNLSALAFLRTCLREYRSYYKLHFTQITEDVDTILKATLSGMNTTPISPIMDLILFLRNGVSDETITTISTNNNKYYYTHLPLAQHYGTIIFSKEREMADLERELGFLVIKNENCKLLHIKTIARDDQISDIDFTSSMRPCNSIVIVDRYILKDENTIKRNLIPVLKKMKSNVPAIHLSILSQFTYNDDRRHLTINEALDKIKNDLAGSGNWKIEILNTEQELHDRVIITNHSYITIGGGFDCRILKDTQIRADKSTIMHTYIAPLLNSDIAEEVPFYITEIKKVMSHLDNTRRKTNMSPKEKIRLLNM